MVLTELTQQQQTKAMQMRMNITPTASLLLLLLLRRQPTEKATLVVLQSLVAVLGLVLVVSSQASGVPMH